MITNLHKKIFENLREQGRSIESIRQVPYFQKLSKNQWQSLLKRMNIRTSTPTTPEETPARTTEEKEETAMKVYSLRIPEDLLNRLDNFIKDVGNSHIGDRVNYLKGKGKRSQVIRIAIGELINKYGNK